MQPHLKVGNGVIITDHLSIINHQLLIDRGYTSHEHFSEVGIIHMNGRLYDPLLRRFLNADENIQDPHNTQNYNKYGYVMNNPLMYNDPSGELFWFAALVPILGNFFAAVVAGAIGGAIIGSAMYLGQAAITGNFSWGGFAKSFFVGALTGAVAGGLGQVFSASGFWATVGNGALAGAGSGGVNSLINGTNFLEGLVKGAVIGGAIGAVSYTINYLVKGYHKSKYTTTEDISPTKNNTIADSKTMNDNIGKARGKINSEINKTAKINSEAVGVSNHEGYMMGSNGKFNVLGKTSYKFWTGKSDILYSTKAASDYAILGRVMSHETAHATAYALNLPNIEIDNLRSFDSLLDDVEHLTIRQLEHTYANKNSIWASRASGYVDINDINLTIGLLKPYEKFVYNLLYKNFAPIFKTNYLFP